jgi:hypothetical protein
MDHLEPGDLESHFWQAVYDDGTVINELDGLVRFCDLDWDRVKIFGWVPKPDADIQTAICVERMSGYRVFARKEGALRFGPGPEGKLVACQQAYSYYIGLYGDDGSEHARDVERGVAPTVAHIDWMGGFRVFLPPDGQLQAIGNFDVQEELHRIDDREVQFLFFSAKPIGGDITCQQ